LTKVNLVNLINQADFIIIIIIIVVVVAIVMTDLMYLIDLKMKILFNYYLFKTMACYQIQSNLANHPLSWFIKLFSQQIILSYYV